MFGSIVPVLLQVHDFGSSERIHSFSLLLHPGLSLVLALHLLLILLESLLFTSRRFAPGMVLFTLLRR